MRDIELQLERAPSLRADDVGTAPRWLGDAFKSLLRLDMFAAYRPELRSNGGWGLGELVTISPNGFFERYDERMVRLPTPFHYDPLHPERSQQNKPFVLRDVHTHGPDERCVVEEIWPEVGLTGHDQIRVLVLRGSLLLAWIGGFRKEPFGKRECDLLSALTPALRRNLGLRRKLVDADTVRAGFERSIPELATPTFVVSAEGKVEYANAVGATLLDRATSETSARLHQAVHGHRVGCEVARLEGACGGSYLVLLNEERPAFERRLAFVVGLWGATPRERDVLRWVVLGDSNKEIALRLKCHEGSVERHLTSLLRKTRCDTRTRMVARFWTVG